MATFLIIDDDVIIGWIYSGNKGENYRNYETKGFEMFKTGKLFPRICSIRQKRGRGRETDRQIERQKQRQTQTRTDTRTETNKEKEREIEK